MSISQRALALVLAVILAPVVATPARATPVVSITYSPYGLPPATGPVQGIDLGNDLGQTAFTVNPGGDAVSVTMQGGAVVQGSAVNQYAAPVTGGTAQNPTYLATPYFSTGGSPNTITLSFAQQQSYLGLLWGSVGAGDYIQFLDSSGNVLGTVTGTQVMNSASGFDGASGAQGFGGSQYTLIDLSGGQFSTVVLGQNAGASFESAAFEYAAQNVSVVEPASLVLLVTGLVVLAALVAIRRRRPL